MNIKNKYELEDEVYLKSDTDQKVRFVTGIMIRPGSYLVYELTCGNETSEHYDFEISEEKNYKT